MSLSSSSSSSSSSSNSIIIKKKPRKFRIIEEEEHQDHKQQNQKFIEFLVYNDEIKNQKIIDYLLTVSEMDLKAMKIAKEHLKSSFNILKSNDYINWISTSSKK